MPEPKTNFNSDAQAGFAAGELASENCFRKTDVEGVPGTVLREGFSLKLHPELMERPKRRSGQFIVGDIDGFCRLFNRYKGFYEDEPIIFVDSDPTGKRPATFKATLNCHGEKPDFGDFHIIHVAQFSVEWNRWMAKNNQAMQHTAFVEHLEDVSDLINEPVGADLLRLIQGLEGTVKARFNNALNLHNGSTKLTYDEEVVIRGSESPAERPGDLVVPTEIICAIPPFEFGAKYKMRNRIRFRVEQKRLTFSYEAIDPHLLIQDAVTKQIAEIESLTSSKPFQGKL